MRCHSVGCGTVSRTQSAMQSATQSFTAVYTMLKFAFSMSISNEDLQLQTRARARRFIFSRAAIRHSNRCREDFGAMLGCAEERPATGHHSDVVEDIRGKSPQPNPTPGRCTFAELARSVRASVPILPIVAPPQTSTRRPAWFLSCL